MKEYWDLYDGARKLSGLKMLRGENVPEGYYHLCVSVWLRNPLGEYLLTQRSPEKRHPLKWECTGGCVQAGEDSLSAALREVREETGVVLAPGAGRLIYQTRRDGQRNFYDVYLFQIAEIHPPLKLQAEEVCAARWVNLAELEEMGRKGLLNPLIHPAQLELLV